MNQLQDALNRGHFLLDLDASDMESACQALVERMVADGMLPEQDADEVVAAPLKREQVAPTAIGHATAIPHAYLDALADPLVVFVRLNRPVNLNAPDGLSTRFLFVLLGPPGAAAEHLDTLANIARLMSNEEFRYDLGRAESRDDLLEAVRGSFRSAGSAVLPVVHCTARPVTSVGRPSVRGHPSRGTRRRRDSTRGRNALVSVTVDLSNAGTRKRSQSLKGNHHD